jgi:glycine dehydrogenase subunit 2
MGGFLMPFETDLLIHQSVKGRCGVDLPTPEMRNRTGQNLREGIGLPEVSEPQVMRHYTRLSHQNYSIDGNFYPLGSCTMKHNPRLNEKLARLEGFAHLHPLQSEEHAQGALEVIYQLTDWLKKLSGMPGLTLDPAAGAHGELTGMMMVRKAHEAKGNPRKIVLVPDSAHGTNPATAATCKYTIVTIKTGDDGMVDMDAFNVAVKEHGEDIAAFMLTNPSTCGLFEPNVKVIADTLHDIGAYFYCDGANFNAIVGKVLPGDLGIDVMQINLHKTFSTPHGGGGPGSGPVMVSEALVPYLPIPYVEKKENGTFALVKENETSIGRIKGFHGQFGMMIRALAYMMSHGADGLQKVAEDAVLNANYILHNLKDDFHVPYPGPCMHECLLTHKKQKEHGVTTMDIAKALLDAGYHPMTVYFPLVVDGAMLIEPTETESRETMDGFIAAMKTIAKRAQDGDATAFHAQPQTTFRKRLDETQAARKPVLVEDK